MSNPSAIPLLLFVDELEVANPLWAGKVRHKINCTYYSHTNIQLQLRSKVTSVQLVSLFQASDGKTLELEMQREAFEGLNIFGRGRD